MLSYQPEQKRLHKIQRKMRAERNENVSTLIAQDRERHTYDNARREDVPESTGPVQKTKE